MYCNGQRTRSRTRSRGNRNRGDQHCHLKEIDSCIDKIQLLTKGTNPTSIITTSEGLDKICGTFNDVIKCVKSFIRKCGTPLQRELFDFGAEYFVQTVKQFCDIGPSRQKFLEYSPCIHNNVLCSQQYKSNCNNNYLAALEYSMNRTEVDERIDTLCCGHNSWEDCSDVLISQSCGSEAQHSFNMFIQKVFGGLTTMICPRNVFPPTANICKKSFTSARNESKN